MTHGSILLFVTIGLVTGIASGLFGIGGGAAADSRADLPGGLQPTRRHGHVDLQVALIMAAAVFVGGWVGAVLANQVSGPYLRLAFAVFVIGIGCYLLYGALKRLSWI
jgi:uncharacterized membrane protein YfcA